MQEQLRLLREARLGDPFLLLGRHREAGQWCIRAWLPQAERVWLEAREGPQLQRVPGSELFVWSGDTEPPRRYRLCVEDRAGAVQTIHDAYAFDEPLIADFDLHLFGQGRHWHAHEQLGAHRLSIDGVDGVRFAVWAPHAERVSVVGDFNRWDGRAHPMRGHDSGVWQLFVPGLAAGALYKFEIRARSGAVLLKSDPYARRFQLRPDTASVVEGPSTYEWNDAAWIERRRTLDWARAPMSIYELHLGSWQRAADGGFLNYREIARRLVPYVTQLGFTHVELLPVTEHPFDGSWGYQTLGAYAPTRRHGSPDDFRALVDACHAAGIGVIMDWVPAHFPKDAHGLARFDGEPLYEYPDPRRGEHPDWGTLVYDYGRPQVRNYLMANALYWIEQFHVDGLRVDAVASMLYLSYSRKPGEWTPNRYGGPEHLEAIDFLRELNTVVHGQQPGAVVIAEESTSWPQVSRPVHLGGLGFSMKWDMGWMHDSLDYFQQDPVYRQYHHHKMTFGLVYAFSENFVLCVSHDEVVHLKKALVEKMPGDEWQKFANLRLFFAWMLTRPGKKLLFMGCEFGQRTEWNHDRELDWWIDRYPLHAGARRCLADLNRLYRELRPLHDGDFDPQGFSWIDCNDHLQSVFAYERRDREGRVCVVLLNCTPVPRRGYRVGVPVGGVWRERLNTDAACYGGGDVGNGGSVVAEALPWMGRPQSLTLTLPPLGALVLTPQS